MDQRSLQNLLTLLLAAGHVDALPVRTPWPMHRALLEFDGEARRRGLLRLLDVDLRFAPSPEAGLAARGADRAFADLLRTGLFSVRGTGLRARYHVEPSRLVAGRRALLGLDPSLVELLQRAGCRWAALACTASKNLVAAAESSEAMVSSATV